MRIYSAGMVAGSVLVAGAGLVGVVPKASASAMAAYTWTGSDAANSTAWSDAGNWQGGIAPASDSTADLSFPASACSASSCPGTQSNNDLSGLTVPSLSLTLTGGAPSGWTLAGNPVTVNTLDATTDTTAGKTIQGANVSLPLQLDPTATSLAWKVSLRHGANLDLSGPITGTPALTVSLPNAASGFAGFLGALSVNTGTLTFKGGTQGSKAVVVAGTSLNGTTKKAVKFVDSSLFIPGNSTASLAAATTTWGPLTVKDTNMQVGNGGGAGPYGLEKIKGGLTLDSLSSVEFFSLEPGTSTRPGLDYPQISASGAANLGSAGLDLFAPCSAQIPGTKYTIITAGNGITGTFSGVPDGTVVAPIGDNTCTGGATPGYSFQINYNTSSVPATVTATVVTPSSAAVRTAAPSHVWRW